MSLPNSTRSNPPPNSADAPRLISMSEHQATAAVVTFTELLGEVRCLRDVAHEHGPADSDLGCLFTNPDDYEVTDDPAVAELTAKLDGLAVGLGFPSTLALYRAYEAGTLQGRPPTQDPAVEALILAADRALTFLAHQGERGSAEITNALGRALAPLRGKAWR